MACSTSQRRFALLISMVALNAAIPDPARAQGGLFDSDELLSLRFEAPFDVMISEKEGRFPAAILFANAPQDTIRLDVAARGKSRLRAGICDFPGLMLFVPDDAAGTVFEGQGPVPVVTHCRDRDSYEQLALLEYIAYRVYSVVTDLSLRVRLARFEYFDSERGRPVANRLGFFLENYDVFAARNNWVRLRIRRVPPDEYVTEQRALFEAFQYFIGNTDWSYAFASPDESECCHNTVPIGNTAGPVYPIPFDFDQAGLVDAPYATVDPSVQVRNVRERLFRGICGSPHQLNGALGTFEVHESEIRALFEDADFLSDRVRSKSLRYVDEFYDTISDDRSVQREFLAKCRTP